MKPRILVIRGGALGDFVLTLPAIGLLRENFPDAHIELLGYKHIIALAEGRFYADATRSIEYGPMARFFVPRSELAPDLAEYFASFQQIVSYLYDPNGYFEANLRRAGARNILCAYAPVDDTEHASHQLARPLQRLALFLEEHAATLHPSSADRDFAAQFLANVGGRLIGIHAGSGSARKNWPVERWVALADALIARDPRCRLLLIGGEADHAQVDVLSAALAAASPLSARDLPLPHLAAILERCDLFLGHDSGVSHIAAAVDIPCVLLFGPTDPTIWAPANPQVKTIQAPEGDLTRLSVDSVLGEMRDLRST